MLKIMKRITVAALAFGLLVSFLILQTALNFGSTHEIPLDNRTQAIDSSRIQAIMLAQGWSRVEPGPVCAAVPNKAYTKGFPFAYERGLRPCGWSEVNALARTLNVLFGLALSAVLFAGLSLVSRRRT